MVDDKSKDEAKPEEQPVDDKPADKPVEVKEEKEDKVEEKNDEKVEGKDEPKPVEETKPAEDTDSTTTPEEEVKPEAKDELIEPKLSNEYKLPSSNTHKPLSHHSSKRLLVVGLVVLVLALFAGAAIWLTHDDPVSTTNESEIVYSQGAAVTAVEGEVEYNNGSGWTLVESGTNIQESDSVRTLEESRAIVTLDDSSAIRLNSDTTVTFVKLTTEEVVIDNDGGEVYVRVSASETRKFYVYVNDQAYLALGTAYKTTNSTDEEGVEVYHSKVKTNDSESKELEVAEGEAFYSKNKDKEQVDKVSKLDIEKLKDDEFLKWNKTKDESEKEYADKLGFLAGLDKAKEDEKEEDTPAPAPAPASSPNGISATGAKVDNGIKVSWSVKGVDTSDGFKIAYSKDDTTPSYGENSAKYVNSDASSQVLELTDGKTWHVRVCAYRGDGVCDSYSNTVSVTAPYKEKEKVVSGTVTATMDVDKVRWTYSGTAPYGFKVTWNTTGSPEYGKDSAKLVSSGNYLNLADKISESGLYYVRICKYTSGTQSEPCINYSNEVQYTVD